MDRADIHRLVDQFPTETLSTLARVLEALRDALAPDDPVARALDAAPPDDEPLTAEDLDAVREGLKDLRHGRADSHEEVLRQGAQWDAEEADW